MLRALSVRIKTWLHYRMIFMPIMVQHVLLIMLESMSQVQWKTIISNIQTFDKRKLHKIGKIGRGFGLFCNYNTL